MPAVAVGLEVGRMAWRYVVQAVCPAVRSFVRCMASFLALRPLGLRMLRMVLRLRRIDAASLPLPA